LLGLLDFIEVFWEVGSGIWIHGERYGMVSGKYGWLAATGEVAVTSQSGSKGGDEEVCLICEKMRCGADYYRTS